MRHNHCRKGVQGHCQRGDNWHTSLQSLTYLSPPEWNKHHWRHPAWAMATPTAIVHLFCIACPHNLSSIAAILDFLRDVLRVPLVAHLNWNKCLTAMRCNLHCMSPRPMRYYLYLQPDCPGNVLATQRNVIASAGYRQQRR
jgi:hypothetical protein